jgi:hypothetical protein
MQSITLPQPWRNLLLTVHVGASVSVLGTDLVLLALGIAGLTGADPLTIYPAAAGRRVANHAARPARARNRPGSRPADAVGPVHLLVGDDQARNRRDPDRRGFVRARTRAGRERRCGDRANAPTFGYRRTPAARGGPGGRQHAARGRAHSRDLQAGLAPQIRRGSGGCHAGHLTAIQAGRLAVA